MKIHNNLQNLNPDQFCRSGGHMYLKYALIIGVILSTSFPTYSQDESRICKIKTLTGSAKVRRSSTVNWMNAKVGMPLKERDGIRTFVESEVELETTEGTIIKIAENSTVELSTFQQTGQNQNTKVKIMNGSIVSNVKKLVNSTSSFEFETPTATAAIRGTKVGFNVNKDATSIKVFEGKVFVTPRGTRKGTELKENEMTTVTKKTKILTIEKIFANTKSDSSSGINTSSSQTTLSDSLDTPATDSTMTRDTIETKASQENDTTDLPLQTPLKINIDSPVEGYTVAASAPITIAGTVSPSKATLLVNGKQVRVGPGGSFKTTINAPQNAGPFEIVATLENEGNSQAVVRSVKVRNPELIFSVLNPKDRQVFSKPLLPVSGTVTPGAEVTIMSTKIPVTAQGTFNSQIPIPNEEGEYVLEFEASIDGKFQKINRKIIYKPEYRFLLIQPQDRQTVTSTSIAVKGEVLPTSATVSVAGKRLAVSSQGTFSGVVTINDKEGPVVLDFDIVSGGISKSERRTVFYKRLPDTFIPQIQGVLPVSSDVKKLTFTVIDRTMNEEITFYCEVDGVKEVQHGQPNSPFYITLQEGIHNYKLYAVDKAGNRSNTISQTVSYLVSSAWNIRLRKPAGDIAVNLPPSTPDGNYKPRYDIEFSLDNLPDNNIKLIKEVTVRNSTTGETIYLRNLTDTYIDVDIGISLNSSNVIVIEAVDANNNKKTKKLQIHAR